MFNILFHYPIRLNMSFLPRELLRYQSYRKETALVPLSPPFSFGVTHYAQWWHIANFIAYLDTLRSYMQEMIPGHLISSSVTEQATHMYQVGGGEKLKAWKRQCLMLSFFRWQFPVLYYRTLQLEMITSSPPSRYQSYFQNCSLDLKKSWKTSLIQVNDI